MKRLILFEIIVLFLATTFESDSPPGWFQQTLPVNDQINDIFFLDSLTGWVVTDGRTSTNDTGYIMKTIDGGNNWSIQYNQPMKLNVVQFLDVNTGYVAGGSGSGIPRLFKTTDGGANWSSIGGSLLGFSIINDLSFINKDTGWICSSLTFGGIGKTFNGGINWILQAGDTAFPNKLFFINRDTGWVGSNEPNGRLFRTTNGGDNWNLQYTFANNIRNILFLNRDTGYIVGAFGSYSISKTTNGGFNWGSTTNSTGGIGLNFVNDLTGYNCAGASIMQKSTDGGNLWFNQTVPAGGYVSIQFTDTSRGWSGGSILIHTTDGGGPLGINQISSEIPMEYKLFQNYPNPFNPVTNIKYSVTSNGKRETSNVKLIVYDIQGKQIAELVNQKQSAGTYLADWPATGYSSGVYFYSLIIDDLVIDTRKMILIK